ncbi:hypothetical protein L195_g034870, partial [Trifolium pratense]
GGGDEGWGGCDRSEMGGARSESVDSFFELIMVSKSAEVCRFLCIRLTSSASVLSVDCLEVDCELRTYLPSSVFLNLCSSCAEIDY